MSNSKGLSLKDKREIKGLYQEVALMMKVAARNLKCVVDKGDYIEGRWDEDGGDAFREFTKDACKTEISEIIAATEYIESLYE